MESEISNKSVKAKAKEIHFWGSKGPAESRVLTCYLRLALRVEGVGHRVEGRPGPLGGNAHPHPHPLKLTQAVGEQSSLGRVLQFLTMPCGRIQKYVGFLGQQFHKVQIQIKHSPRYDVACELDY